MEAPEKNGTIPGFEEHFAEMNQNVDKARQKLANTERLLEHAQRELALALIRIEELEGADEREAEEKEARDA